MRIGEEKVGLGSLCHTAPFNVVEPTCPCYGRKLLDEGCVHSLLLLMCSVGLIYAKDVDYSQQARALVLSQGHRVEKLEEYLDKISNAFQVEAVRILAHEALSQYVDKFWTVLRFNNAFQVQALRFLAEGKRDLKASISEVIKVTNDRQLEVMSLLLTHGYPIYTEWPLILQLTNTFGLNLLNECSSAGVRSPTHSEGYWP